MSSANRPKPIAGYYGPDLETGQIELGPEFTLDPNEKGKRFVQPSTAFVIEGFEQEKFEEASQVLDIYTDNGMLSKRGIEMLNILLKPYITPSVINSAGAIKYIVQEMILRHPNIDVEAVSTIGIDAVCQMCEVVLGDENYWPELGDFDAKLNPSIPEVAPAHVDGMGYYKSYLLGFYSPELSPIEIVGLVEMEDIDPKDGTCKYVGPAYDINGKPLIERVQPNPGSFTLIRLSSSVHEHAISADNMLREYGIDRHRFVICWDFEEFINAVNEVLQNPSVEIDLAEQLRSQLDITQTQGIDLTS